MAEILISDILADPDFNCRGAIAPIDVTELMESISKNGLLQGIVVQPIEDPKFKYKVILGHRRLKACQLLKWSYIPATVKEGLDEKTARALNLIENLAREDLTVMQEARALEKFLRAGVTMQEVGKLINKSYGWIQVRFTALKLPVEIQAEIDAGFINQEQIKELYAIGNKEAMFEAVKSVKDARLRGDTSRIKLRAPKAKAPDLFSKRPRSIQEILKMQTIIQDSLGNNLTTRFAAWAMGEITAKEFYVDITEYANNHGKTFTPPN